MTKEKIKMKKRSLIEYWAHMLDEAFGEQTLSISAEDAIKLIDDYIKNANVELDIEPGQSAKKYKRAMAMIATGKHKTSTSYALQVLEEIIRKRISNKAMQNPGKYGLDEYSDFDADQVADAVEDEVDAIIAVKEQEVADVVQQYISSGRTDLKEFVQEKFNGVLTGHEESLTYITFQ